MIKAELISDVPQARQTVRGSEIRIAHVQTNHGITRVRSVIPPNASREIFVAGGLLSGANYERVVNRAAAGGIIVRTVRNGSNSIYGATDADADEFAGSIEQLAKGPIDIVAHSFGVRVAIKAAARLDPSVGLRSIECVNGAIEKSQFPTPLAILGAAREQFACIGKLRNAAEGVFHEITRRGLGVIGETLDLLRTDETLDDDFAAVRARGVHLDLFDGSFDHIVPAANTATVLQHMHFDSVETMEGAVAGSHFGLLASDSAVDLVLAHAS
jgi:pimeloyl-ACP methyl ester carboxylesterase